MAITSQHTIYSHKIILYGFQSRHHEGINIYMFILNARACEHLGVTFS